MPYPISSKNIFSLIGSDTKNLSYLLKKVASNAVPNPMRTDSTQFFKKLPNNSMITVAVRIVSPVELTMESTESKRIIATASLRRPSPKTILNNLGYVTLLIRVKAAIASEAHIVALKYKISLVFKLTIDPFMSTIQPADLAPSVMKRVIKKLTSVPATA